MSKNTTHFLSRIGSTLRNPMVWIIIGILLRLNHYLEQRSFWLDEAYVAVDVMIRTFEELFFGQLLWGDLASPPIGFMLGVKSCIYLFGPNELAIRLIPFIFGVGALFLFYQFAKKHASPPAQWIALALFALCDAIVYYSAELKPYSSDLAVALILVLYGFRNHRQNFTIRQAVGFSLMGIAAIICSYTSVFILAAIGIIMTWSSFVQRKWEKALRVFIAGCFWVLMSMTLYFTYLRGMSRNNIIMNILKGSEHMSSAPIWSKETALWIWESVLRIFEQLIDIYPAVIGILLIMIGTIVVYKRDKENCFLLVLPLMLIFTAALMKKYPFGGRFLLFTVPFMILLLAEGAQAVIERFKRFSMIAGIIVLGFIFVKPVTTAAHFLTSPRGNEEIKPVVQFLTEHYREGDVLIYNNSAQYGFYFYADVLGLPGQVRYVKKLMDDVYPRGNQKFLLYHDEMQIINFDRNLIYIEQGKLTPILQNDFKKFGQNKRTWLLLSHTKPPYPSYVLNQFHQAGRLILSHEARGASLYLFDLAMDQNNRN